MDLLVVLQGDRSLLMTYHARIRFYEELNDFLPHRYKKRDIQAVWEGKRSLKDLIESYGVPHSEVDLVLVNGEPGLLETLVSDDAEISVYPMFETFDISGLIGREGLRNPRFIVDENVTRLCRYMRMLGFDSVLQAGDHQIVADALSEKRIILTRDQRLLMHRDVTHGLYLRATKVEEQAREVVRRLQLQSLVRPLSRCLECNHLLEKTSTPPDRVPSGVREWANEYRTCPNCERVYWKGSHYERMVRSIAYISQSDGAGILELI